MNITQTPAFSWNKPLCAISSTRLGFAHHFEPFPTTFLHFYDYLTPFFIKKQYKTHVSVPETVFQKLPEIPRFSAKIPFFPNPVTKKEARLRELLFFIFC